MSLQENRSMDSVNQQILDEVNQAKLWFFARKTKPLWAKQLDQTTVVKSLEGEVTAQAGDYLCMGEQGDQWTQAEKTLLKKYTLCRDNRATQQDVEKLAQGWEKFIPLEEAAGVFAAKIDHPFHVQATWGELKGNVGDYLVKHQQDYSTLYPEDIWIVNQAIFIATYKQYDNLI